MPLLSRREFLLASSATAGAVVFAGCVPPAQEMEAESRVLLAEDLLSAYDNWYATTCRGCPAGCGVVVRVVDGRARKVEGNPDHPLNRGKLCARGQALVQEQYHPDRLRGPLRRDPANSSSGDWQSVSWDTALDSLVDRLRNLATTGRAGDVTLVSPPLRGHQALLVDRFARAYGLKWLQFEAISEAPLREAARRVFGVQQLPRFDLENARTVLSFGADFLGGWLSQVHFGRAYGIFRQGSYDARQFQPNSRSGRPRGRLIHVDTRFSATAASADEWVWVRPGAEGVLALAFASALGGSGLDAFAPEQTADRTGVDPGRVRRIAREVAGGAPALVIGGGSAGAYTSGTDNLVAILELNLLLGNVGRPGGVLAPPAAPPVDLPDARPTASLADWQDLMTRLSDGREQAVLFVGGANPVHGLPAHLGLRQALLRAPFVASFASFIDDTTRLADLILPSSLPLEDWGDDLPEPGVSASVLSVQQPIVQALFDTRGVWDVLLALADELGGPVQQALPWPTFKDLLQDQLAGLRAAGRGSVQADNPPQFWNRLLQHGGWWDEESPPPPGFAASTTFASSIAEPRFDGDPSMYPFYLAPFVHNTLGAGESAHLPWLQAAPDPLTTVTWQTWVEVNPRTAADVGVSEGDMVGVESSHGRIEVPVYVTPAAPPDVLAVPLGQGHSGSGRWADARGANPLDLLAPLSDASTGGLAYGATRVRLTRTGRKLALPKFEGEAPVRQLPGQEVIEVLRG